MKELPTRYQNLIQFIKFGIVGASGTLISLMILFTFTEYFAFKYWMAGIFGYLIGITNNFLLNRKFTFAKTKNPLFRDYIKYVLSMGVGAVIYTMSTIILTEYFDIWYFFSGIISTGFSFIVNFLFSKYWVFRNGFVFAPEDYISDDKNDISVKLIISCLNEEKNVGVFVDDLLDNLDKRIHLTLCLVDNGSTDRTREVLTSKISRSSQNVTIMTITRDESLPYGKSIRNAILDIKKNDEQQKYDYIGWAWSDNQIQGQDVARVMQNLTVSEPSMIKGMRYEKDYSKLRKIQSFIFNIIITFLFLTKIQDVNGCPKFMKTEYWNLLDLYSDNWFLDAEVYLKMTYLVGSHNILQIPVRFNERKQGKTKTRWYTAFELLVESLKFRFYKKGSWIKRVKHQ